MSLLLNWLESLHEDTKITSKCSRTRNRKSTCSYCMEKCSYQAIEKIGHLLFIDPNRCTLCGECMVVCPLAAIKGKAVSRRFEKGSLIFDDSYVPTINELLIYKKKGLKSIQVIDEPINQEWKSVLETANDQLTLLNEGSIVVVQKDKNEVLSRRAFLHSFQNSGKNLVKNIVPIAWRMDMDEWKLTNCYPDFQFYTVVIDKQKCTFCRSCFSLCPEQVFTVLDSVLQIKSEKCINCTSCIDICSAEAIKITPEIKGKEKRLESFYKNNCHRCGHNYFTFQQETTQCPICLDRDPEWLSPYS